MSPDRPKTKRKLKREKKEIRKERKKSGNNSENSEDSDPIEEITAISKGKNMDDLKARMLERMRARSVTPVPEKAESSEIPSKKSSVIKFGRKTLDESR